MAKCAWQMSMNKMYVWQREFGKIPDGNTHFVISSVSVAKKVKSPRQKRFGKISRVRLAIGAKKVKSPRQKRFGKISRVRLAIGRKPLSDCNFGKKIAVRCVDFTKLTSFLSQATSSSYSTHC